MIEFKRLTIEGFGSFLKPFSYVLEGPGMHLIGGKNGSGKTTIFSALCWCLFDKPLKSKDVTPWSIPKDFKGTKVSVEFTKDNLHYRVIRSKDGKRNQLFLYKAGAYVQDLRDKRDVQKAIEEILGVSFNLFKNSIVFGQNLTRLMRETGPKQKEIFDEAFEVTYINEAKVKASKELANLQKEGDEYLSKLENLNKLIESENRRLEAYEEQEVQTQEGIKELEKDLEENKQKIKAEKTKEATQKANEIQTLSLEKKVEKLKKLEDDHFKLDFTHEQEKAETEGFRQKYKKLAEFLTKRTPVCDRCGQAADGKKGEKLRERQRTEKEELRTQINARSLEDSKREAELAQLISSIEKYKKYREELKKLQRQILEQKNNKDLLNELKGARLRMEKKLENLRAQLSTTLDRVDNCKNALQSLEKKKADLESKYQRIAKQEKLHRWLVDDPLSNKGLKAFIFDAMLGSINERLAHYGSYTGNVVEFSIDLDSGNKNFEAIIRDGDQIKPYDSMSGGEQQLIDICLAFSIHDVMTQTKSFNILLMDEIFESLDSDNVELVSELLSIKAQHTAIHIITHQQSMTFNQVTSHTILAKTKKGTIAVQ
jgi:DNA repair exonuclease SbcCD ATPase subunit